MRMPTTHILIGRMMGILQSRIQMDRCNHIGRWTTGECIPLVRIVFSLLILSIASSSKYHFECEVTLESFMSWQKGQLQQIAYGKSRKVPGKKAYARTTRKTHIAIPYARIIHQLILEDRHGRLDMGHESLRRRTYAQMMLDEFGKELDGFRGQAENFRSKVLTPVLQRQLRGVPDAYAPVIQSAIAQCNTKPPTIAQVTTFYLGNDPLDPICIPSYRRNLVYIREAMWHLSILTGKVKVGDGDDFKFSLESHDLIMEALQDGPSVGPKRGIPPLEDIEVFYILDDELDGFFDEELSRVVGNHIRPLVWLLTIYL